MKFLLGSGRQEGVTNSIPVEFHTILKPSFETFFRPPATLGMSELLSDKSYK